jgi:hypothetical protein
VESCRARHSCRVCTSHIWVRALDFERPAGILHWEIRCKAQVDVLGQREADVGLAPIQSPRDQLRAKAWAPLPMAVASRGQPQALTAATSCVAEVMGTEASLQCSQRRTCFRAGPATAAACLAACTRTLLCCSRCHWQFQVACWHWQHLQ